MISFLNYLLSSSISTLCDLIDKGNYLIREILINVKVIKKIII